MAGCWFNATEIKPQNVVCNIFSELTPKASLLFFRKKLIEIVTENLARKLKTEPNFVDKLCAEITFSGKYVVKLKPETKRCVKIYFARQSELCRKTLR